MKSVPPHTFDTKQELQHQQQASTAASESQAEAAAAEALLATERAGMQRAVNAWREQASATQGELLKAQGQLRALRAEQERERGEREGAEAALARTRTEMEGLLSELAVARRAQHKAEEAARLMLAAADVGGEMQEVAATLQREVDEAQAAIERERARVRALKAEGERLCDEVAAAEAANAFAREGLEAAEAAGRAVEEAAGAWRERRVLVDEVNGLRAALERKDDELAAAERARDGACVLCASWGWFGGISFRSYV